MAFPLHASEIFDKSERSQDKFAPRPVKSIEYAAKNRAIFLERFFWERNYCPRTALGREITAGTCSLHGNEGTLPDFERFFLEKSP